MNDISAVRVCYGVIAVVLFCLWLLLQVAAGKSKELGRIRRYHSIYVLNACVLFLVQIAVLAGVLILPNQLMGFWGVMAFALVPFSLLLHVLAAMRDEK